MQILFSFLSSFLSSFLFAAICRSQQKAQTLPVDIVLAVHPVNLLEKLIPAPPVLQPRLLLRTVTKLVAASRPPELVDCLQVCFRYELYLEVQS